MAWFELRGNASKGVKQMNAEAESPEAGSRAPGGFARAAVWLAGSAFLGSLALVLWNRRALKSLREAEESRVEPPQPRNDDGIY
jgi:hypothetical protein